MAGSITYRDGVLVNAGNPVVKPLSIAQPGGTAVGDFLLLHLVFGNDPGAITPPAGWTQIGTTYFDGTDAIRSALFWRTATAGGSSTTHSFTWTASVAGGYSLTAWTGVDPTVPIAVAPANDPDGTHAGVTTTGPDQLAVFLPWRGASLANTEIGNGWTRRLAGQGFYGQGVYTRREATAAATGAADIGGQGTPYGSTMLALAPASPTATTGPRYRSQSAVTTGTGTAISVPKPSDLQDGDVVLTIVWYSQFANWTWTSGATSLLQRRISNASATTSRAVDVGWKVVTNAAGEGATTATCASTTNGWRAVNVAFRGVALADVIDAFAHGPMSDGVAGPTAYPAITTDVPNDLVLYLTTWNSSPISSVAEPAPTGAASLVADTLIRLDAMDQDTAGAAPAVNRERTSSAWGVIARIALTNANQAPGTPALTAPANAGTAPLHTGGTFSWTFSDPDVGDTQSAYAFRRKVTGAGSYEYWNQTLGAWQSTEVYNSSTSGSLTFPAGLWTSGQTYQWSVSTRDQMGASSGYATDSTVTVGQAPTVTVTGPSGSITTTSRPTVTWSYADTENDPQESYRVKVFTAAQYGAGGFDPATSTPTVDSGLRTSSAARSWDVTADLANSTTFRAYVQVTQAGGTPSAWAFQTFTLALTTPVAPTITATYDPALAAVSIAVTATVGGTFTAANTTAKVERSLDGGATWEVVRDAERVTWTTGTTVTVLDREAPPGVPVQYRASTIGDV